MKSFPVFPVMESKSTYNFRKTVRDGLASNDIGYKHLCLEILKAKYIDCLQEREPFDEIYSLKKTVRDGIASKDIGYKHLCLEIIQSHLYC
jgi:hypothetical protein